MKKIIFALVAAILATTTMARPSYNYQVRRFGDGPAWARHHYHGWHGHHAEYYHHGSFWGRGGRNFWPGFVGGAIGAAVVNAVTQPTVVVTPPAVVTTPQVVAPQVVTQPVVTQPVVTQPVQVYQPTQVWVPGQWVYTTGPYGTVRTWQPGHYEVR